MKSGRCRFLGLLVLPSSPGRMNNWPVASKAFWMPTFAMIRKREGDAPPWATPAFVFLLLLMSLVFLRLQHLAEWFEAWFSVLCWVSFLELDIPPAWTRRELLCG